MSDYSTTGDLNEIIHYERLDADIQQAEWEAEGNRYAAKLRKVEAAKAAGDTALAVSECPHGHVGDLTGSCSEEDPRFGEAGYRCYECGGVVDEIHGEVVHVR